MYTEIAAAIQSAKTLAELLKAAKSLSNYNELVAAVSEVNSRLMEATAVALASQEKHSQLNARIAELESELAKTTAWESKIKRYQLVEFPKTGVLVYELRSDFEDSEPKHYLCPNCADKKQISMLQPLGKRRFLNCNTCKASYQIEHLPDPNIKRSNWMAHT